MTRLLTIILIGISAFFILQNRFRIINWIVGNAFLRKAIVTGFMNLPFVQKIMMKSVMT